MHHGESAVIAWKNIEEGDRGFFFLMCVLDGGLQIMDCNHLELKEGYGRWNDMPDGRL